MPTRKKNEARAAKKQPKKRAAVVVTVSTLPPDVIAELLDGSFDMSLSAKSSSAKRHTHYWWVSLCKSACKFCTTIFSSANPPTKKKLRRAIQIQWNCPASSHPSVELLSFH
jgi:hypothetical protein